MKTRAAVRRRSCKPPGRQEVSSRAPVWPARSRSTSPPNRRVATPDEFSPASEMAPIQRAPVSRHLRPRGGAGVPSSTWAPKSPAVKQGDHVHPAPKHPEMPCQCQILAPEPPRPNPVHGPPRHPGQGSHARRQPARCRHRQKAADPSFHGVLDVSSSTTVRARRAVAKVPIPTPLRQDLHVRAAGRSHRRRPRRPLSRAKVRARRQPSLKSPSGWAAIGLNLCVRARAGAGAGRIIRLDLNPRRRGQSATFPLRPCPLR